MIPQDKLDTLIRKFEKLEASMSAATKSDEIVRLSKEHRELQPVVEKSRELGSIRKQMAELEELSKGGDAEMAAMAYDELQELKAKEPEVEYEIQVMLLPKDK
ncbi:MAG: PCRF domain-containing protein, partial [Amphiplicatus sp.]